jgi:HopA1 effector protein family
MSPYRQQLAAALDAVAILGPTRYAWMGRASRALPRSVHAQLTDPERRNYLIGSLREELYASFYCHGHPVPARWGEPDPAPGDPWLLRAMSQANTGRGSWDPAWTVERVEDGIAVVANAHLRMRVPTHHCRADGGSLEPGTAIAVQLPKELPELSPGYYTIVSDSVHPGRDAPALRVYWNVAPTGTPALVRALSFRLNREQVPFRLKVANHPARLTRCDSAVLYLTADTFSEVRKLVHETAADLSAQLRSAIPAFTQELAPGVGLAEDDGDGYSFGLKRCALLADAIVRADSQGVTAMSARVDIVAARFAEAGLSVDAPYLAASFAGCHVL